MVQHLFIAPHNLVVEGTSDFTYMTVISDFLRGKEGYSALDQRWSIVPAGGAELIPSFVALVGNKLEVTVVVDSRKGANQRLQKMASDGLLRPNRIIGIGSILGTPAADIEDLFEPSEYLELYNAAFGAKLDLASLSGTDPIVARIARNIGVDRFDHGVPADHFLRNRDKVLPHLTEESLRRFSELFRRVNATLP